MEHNTFFKLVYTFFLGLVIAILFGVGIQAFYEAPPAPDYPNQEYMYRSEPPTKSEQTKLDKEQREFDNKMKDYEVVRKAYEQNVSIILLVLAVVAVVTAFVLSTRIRFLSDGILLGGLFTLVHGLIRGFAADNTKYLFIASCVSLAVVLFLGYRRFLVPDKKPSRKKK